MCDSCCFCFHRSYVLNVRLLHLIVTQTSSGFSNNGSLRAIARFRCWLRIEMLSANAYGWCVVAPLPFRGVRIHWRSGLLFSQPTVCEHTTNQRRQVIEGICHAYLQTKKARHKGRAEWWLLNVVVQNCTSRVKSMRRRRSHRCSLRPLHPIRGYDRQYSLRAFVECQRNASMLRMLVRCRVR